MEKKPPHLRDDIYQAYHPFVVQQLATAAQSGAGRKGITLDAERAMFMFDNQDVAGMSMVDIGANQGYFSVECALRGARRVRAYESDPTDGAFLADVSAYFPALKAIEVCPYAYDFNRSDADEKGGVICLNVLHHVGRYFDGHVTSLPAAKALMGRYLQGLLASGSDVWLQLGYNWQGDPLRPMLPNGTKREMTAFVLSLLEDKGRVEKIGIYNPDSLAFEAVAYADDGNPLWNKLTHLGEFANRPLYLIKSAPQ